jgi:glycosyltransferase involved in cell wall biosynthesis
MKIAVFARSLWRKSTGRGALARELLECMVRSPDPPEIDLFAGEEVGLDRCRFHRARGTGLLSDVWRVFRGIAGEVKDLKPDVFWGTTHFLPRGLPPDLPKVTTLLDLVWKDHPETLGRPNRLASGWLERGLWESSRILCISKFTRDRLRATWPTLADRATVIPLAANPRLRVPGNSAEILANLGLKGDYILNVDTFEPRKNLRLLLKAMSRLPRLTLVHCGPVGWNVEQDLAYARTLANVRLLGYVDEERLGALYAHAQSAVFPSIYEGFHLAPLDALSLGTPVLASDIPVHREVLGDAALYFEAGSAGDLESKIVALAGADRERLADQGRKRAATYSWDTSARRVLEALQGAASRRDATT